MTVVDTAKLDATEVGRVDVDRFEARADSGPRHAAPGSTKHAAATGKHRDRSRDVAQPKHRLTALSF